MTYSYCYCLLGLSIHGCSERVFLIVRHSLSIVRQADLILESVMFCFMVYCAP